MSERQTPDGVPMADEIALSPAAAAVLEFTSNIGETKRPGQLTYITSKDAYIWAGVAALVAQYATQGKAKLIEDVEIHAQLYNEIPALLRTFPPLPLPFFLAKQSEPENNLARRPSIQIPPFDILTKEIDRIRLGTHLVSRFLNSLISPPISFEDVVNQVNKNIHQGYNELLVSDLISDPVIETTLVLAILPFVPFSIVKRTKRGHIVYRRIQAALWKYERSSRSGGDIQINLTFEAARIAKAIKVGLTAAFHEATKGPGDEPDE